MRPWKSSALLKHVKTIQTGMSPTSRTQINFSDTQKQIMMQEVYEMGLSAEYNSAAKITILSSFLSLVFP